MAKDPTYIFSRHSITLRAKCQYSICISGSRVSYRQQPLGLLTYPQLHHARSNAEQHSCTEDEELSSISWSKSTCMTARTKGWQSKRVNDSKTKLQTHMNIGQSRNNMKILSANLDPTILPVLESPAEESCDTNRQLSEKSHIHNQKTINAKRVSLVLVPENNNFITNDHVESNYMVAGSDEYDSDVEIFTPSTSSVTVEEAYNTNSNPMIHVNESSSESMITGQNDDLISGNSSKDDFELKPLRSLRTRASLAFEMMNNRHGKLLMPEESSSSSGSINTRPKDKLANGSSNTENESVDYNSLTATNWTLARDCPHILRDSSDLDECRSSSHPGNSSYLEIEDVEYDTDHIEIFTETVSSVIIERTNHTDRNPIRPVEEVTFDNIITRHKSDDLVREKSRTPQQSLSQYLEFEEDQAPPLNYSLEVNNSSIQIDAAVSAHPLRLDDLRKRNFDDESELNGNKAKCPRTELAQSNSSWEPTPNSVHYNQLSDCDLVVFTCKILENLMEKYLEVDEQEAETLGNVVHRLTVLTAVHSFPKYGYILYSLQNHKKSESDR